MEVIIEPRRGVVLGVSMVALLAGIGIGLIAVLPAEYGLDPTGLGRRLGLLSLSGSAAAEPLETASEVTAGRSKPARESFAVVLQPGDGREFKVNMLKGNRLAYRWFAERIVHVDLHGEPAGDTSGYYESYSVTQASEMQGQFAALFDGTHGWYWRNDGDAPVTVELDIQGQFLGVVE